MIAYKPTVCVVMPCIVLAYIVMACIAMAYLQSGLEVGRVDNWMPRAYAALQAQLTDERRRVREFRCELVMAFVAVAHKVMARTLIVYIITRPT